MSSTVSFDMKRLAHKAGSAPAAGHGKRDAPAQKRGRGDDTSTEGSGRIAGQGTLFVAYTMNAGHRL